MKKLTPFVIFLACIGWADAQIGNPATGGNATFDAATADEKAVRQTEMRRFELTVQKDLKALAELLGEDLTYTHSNGLLDGKEQYLQTLESGKTLYQSIKSEEIKVRVLGETAIVNGLASMRVWSNGQTNDLRLRYTDVYAKRNGRWLLVAWQSTRL